MPSRRAARVRFQPVRRRAAAMSSRSSTLSQALGETSPARGLAAPASLGRIVEKADRGGGQRLLFRQRGQYPRQACGQHRLPGAGRAHQRHGRDVGVHQQLEAEGRLAEF